MGERKIDCALLIHSAPVGCGIDVTVWYIYISNVSALMMQTKKISDSFGFNTTLTRLIILENFSISIHNESLKVKVKVKVKAIPVTGREGP
jgi:hypothetical protein